METMHSNPRKETTEDTEFVDTKTIFSSVYSVVKNF